MADIPLERELAGLPELEAFPSAEQREAALRSIAARHEDPYAWEYWLWGAVLLTAALSGAMFVIWILRRFGVPAPIPAALGVITGFAIHAFLYRAVHRWAARPALREELARLAAPEPRP